MGWDGSGNFDRTDGTRSGTQVWQNARDAGVAIRADDHDTHDQDIADGLENTVALDGQNTTTTDNAILRFDAGNSSFEGVTIAASEIVGRGPTGDVRSLSAATARKILGMGATAVPTNDQALFYSSAASEYTQRTGDAARKLLNLGTAAPTNNDILRYSSATSTYARVSGSNLYAQVFYSRDTDTLGVATTNWSFLGSEATVQAGDIVTIAVYSDTVIDGPVADNMEMWIAINAGAGSAVLEDTNLRGGYLIFPADTTNANHNVYQSHVKVSKVTTGGTFNPRAQMIRTDLDGSASEDAQSGSTAVMITKVDRPI